MSDVEIKNAADLMQEATGTWRERNNVYGSSYHKHGRVMAELYPKGLTLVTPHDFNLQGVLNMIISKLCRLSQSPEHRDSIHDIGVYAFMYEELLVLREQQMAMLEDVADTLIPFSIIEHIKVNVPPKVSIEELKRHMSAGTAQANWEAMTSEQRAVARGTAEQ